MSEMYREFGAKIMEIKVAEIRASLDERRGDERLQKLTQLKLTRISSVNFL